MSFSERKFDFNFLKDSYNVDYEDLTYFGKEIFLSQFKDATFSDAKF